MIILIVDGTNIYLRNYAAVPTLSIHGAPIGGITGFLRSLNFLNNLVKPDKVIICWDGANGSQKRRSIYPEYKRKRKPTKLNRTYEYELENTEENKIQQRIRLGEYLSYLPVTQITVDNIEADDIVGYLCNFYSNEKKVIVSSDKDFFQLLNENTVIYNPHLKQLLNNKAVYATYNIHPKNFALARAFIGDKSDNLSGVKGIGLKNLLKYFPEFSGTEKLILEDLLEKRYNEKKYEKFATSKEVIIKNFQVMRLDSSLISFNSVQKIHNSLENEISFNQTLFKMKLIEDGIVDIKDESLNYYKILDIKGKV